MDDFQDLPPVAAIAALARQGAAELATITLNQPMPGLPVSIPVLLDKAAGTARGLKDLFEWHRINPARATGTATVNSIDSLVDLINRHKTDSTAIFGDPDWKKPTITAVIDYHRIDHTPDFLGHRIGYSFPLSDEWAAWMAINGKRMNQTEFAEFIEDHIAECASPTPAEIDDYKALFSTTVAWPNDLMQLSRGLQVMADIRVKNAVTLQTGEAQITFEEMHKDAAGGALVVPGIFILAIRPFFDGEIARIPVRLRYRLLDGKVNWIMQLFRPDKWITEELRRDMQRVADATALPLYLGTPERA